MSAPGPTSTQTPTHGPELAGSEPHSPEWAGSELADPESASSESADLATLPEDNRDLAEIPSVEVISRAAVMLMSAAAERLGLGSDDPLASPHRDLDEARRLITALAGLVTATAEYLGAHAGPLREGLASLQLAFREYSAEPDAPGQGPGENLRTPQPL